MVLTARVPLPVAFSSMPGCAAGAASAVGNRLHPAAARFLAGCEEPPVICSSSVTFSLSAESAKVMCGVAKLVTLALPVALVAQRGGKVGQVHRVLRELN